MSELGFVSVTLTQIGWIIGAYLLGSISFGILLSRAFGLADPRTVGSGNIGATNIARSGNKKAAILTLLGDALKGWLPVFVAQQVGLSDGYICAVALAAFLGHLYPIYYGFKGGKGVATALGVLVAFSLNLGLLVLGVWLMVFAASRFASLGSIIAAALTPVFTYKFYAYAGYWVTALVLALLIIWRHRANIARLLNGTEAGFKKK